MKFRRLKAEEIDVRVASAKQNGVSLLLYKDARVDQNILDETVGPFNWQRDHKELKGVIYCGIGIRNQETQEWIWKWDAGSESFSDKEKGEASDSFKRAGFNWGIGRELYTSPFIWVNSENATITPKGNGFACYDNFKVKEIGYDENGNINHLTITNSKTRKVVFALGKIINKQKETEKKLITEEQIKEIKILNVNIEGLLKYYKISKLEDLEESMARFVINAKLKEAQRKTPEEVDVTEQSKSLEDIVKD